MVAGKMSRSSEIRKSLGHPVIDADGHVQEILPLLVDYVGQVGGTDMARAFEDAHFGSGSVGARAAWYSMTPEERMDTRTLAPTWWVTPSRNTLDRAAAHIPGLLYNRLDEMGLDFAIMYPTVGLSVASSPVPEKRRVVSRAFNIYQADMFREYSSRITPAAAIPMHTPDEAIDALDHAVKVLGLKVMMLPGYVARPIAGVHRKHPGLDPGIAEWIDTFAIDSIYDYDPVWAKCEELGVAPAQHSGAYGWGARGSVNNFQYNGTGHFGVTGEAMCKALFMGGVTRRFPKINFAFLEGGVAWACDLYSQMVSRWTKRNPQALMENLNPYDIDIDSIARIMDRYGSPKVREKREQMREYLGVLAPIREPLDDWAGAKIQRAEDIRDLFEPRFYFGCEGDDTLVPWAFSSGTNKFGARLRAVYGSDIGHWDVPDMSAVLEEAHEPVEKGLLGEEDFRDFVFGNSVRLYGNANPEFFKGTAIEAEAARLLSEEG